MNDLKSKTAKDHLLNAVDRPERFKGTPYITRHVPGLEMNQLRDLADQLRNKLGQGIVILSSTGNGKVQLVVTVSKDLTPHFHSGKIIKELAGLVGGGGGGRPDMAQAGSTRPDQLVNAMKQISLILERLYIGE